MPSDPEKNPADDASSASGASTRRSRAATLASEIVQNGIYADEVAEAEILAKHPELMPELAEELRNAVMVRRAIEAALRTSNDEQPSGPLRVLTFEEAEQPIDLSKLDGPTPGLPANGFEAIGPLDALPRIPGCTLVEEINRGAQGAVYLGIQASTGQTVAVKVLDGYSLGDSRHRARFEREAQILAAIKHPHVVRIFDRGRTSDGAFFLIMEHVAGLDLDRWLGTVQETPDGTRKIVELFVKVCRGVDAAHRAGIVHRDLKPSNIRVDEQGEPRVLDFGLARRPIPVSDDSGHARRNMTVVGQILGSIPWSSPEQACGDVDAVVPASDVYSIGVMLYQSLTGHFPYAVDGRLLDVLASIANSRVSPPSADRRSRRLGRAGAMDAIVMRCLAKRPDGRYTDAGELADDLGRLLANQDVRAPRHARGLLPTLGMATAVVAAILSLIAVVNHLRGPRPPTVFNMPEFQNSVGMRLIKLPGGQAMLGSPQTEIDRDPAMEAQKVIVLSSFCISTTEVTQGQYQQIMGVNPSDARWRAAELPVGNVSWDDAVEFCRRLSIAEHRTYRLPSTAEWEYACRAGDHGPFGSAAGISYVGWTAENSGGSPHAGQLKWPNAWGIYDMHGNASEWCEDAVPALLTNTSEDREMRGGSAVDSPDRCRAASRSSRRPFDRLPLLGFRVVANDLPGAEPSGGSLKNGVLH